MTPSSSSTRSVKSCKAALPSFFTIRTTQCHLVITLMLGTATMLVVDHHREDLLLDRQARRIRLLLLRPLATTLTNPALLRTSLALPRLLGL